MEVCAVCHLHSCWSYDGTWTIRELAASLSARGCQVMMMTEHDRGYGEERYQRFRQACSEASSGDILVVPGMEYSDAANRIHVLVWGLDRFLGQELPTAEMLHAAKAANGIAVLAHPSRKDAWRSYQPEWAPLLTGIEVWNRKYDGWAPSHTAPRLIETSHLMPFVGLDFHTDRQMFPLRMALHIDGAITETSVLAAIRAGRCAPRAFNRPLSNNIFRSGESMWRTAEFGRRRVASILRSSKAIARTFASRPRSQ